MVDQSRRTSSVQSKVILGFVFSAVALLSLGWLSYRALTDLIVTQEWVAHTQEVISTLESGLAILTDAESSQRSFLLTGDELFMKDSMDAQAKVSGWIANVRRLTRDNSDQQRRLAALESVISERLAVLNSRSKLRQEQGLQAAASAVATRQGKVLMDRVWNGVEEMRDVENNLLTKRREMAKASTRTSLFVIVSCSALACVIGLASVLMIKRDLRLREQAEQERDRFFNLSLDFLCIASADGYFKRISPAVTDILGWSQTEILARPYIEFVHPEDKEATQREVERQVVAREKVLQFENRYRHKDGSWRVLSWRSVPQPDGLMYATARDVTALKAAAETLRRSEESLSVTLQSIGDAVLATDAQGRVTRLNAVAEQLSGWTQAEAVGRPVAEVFKIINEQTRQPALIPVDDVLRTGTIHGLANHTVLVARDGTERPIADSAAPIRDREERILGVVLVFRDVSREYAAQRALRESELRYRTLFDSIDEGFCIIEVIFDGQNKAVDYRFLEINPSFEKQSGLKDARGRRMREFAPDHEEHWFETFGRIVTTGEPARFQNRAEQFQRWFDVYAFRFGEPNSRQVAILFSDITARKTDEEKFTRLNAELSRQAAQLEAANRELESFSYSVSHDLRAPLRHIDGYVEMLTRDLGDTLGEKSRRHLKVVADSAAQMGQLIDDLLAFSRMGRTEMLKSVVDAGQMTRELIEEFQAETTGRDITWKQGDLPVVEGDASMLRQVFVNLLSNAVKYTGRKEHAEIEIGCTSQTDEEAVLFVRDNGAGFDMQYADKLFGVFQRLHRNDEFEGTGIGLANVRRIINRHGGRIWAEAQVDAGATFHFSLKKPGKGKNHASTETHPAG